MKALILAAGKGTRLYPATKSTPKPLMPLAGKETLCYIIDEIIENNINDIGVVVSNENENEISSFIKKNYPNNNILTIVQNEQLGVAHAVKISKQFINQDNFILYLGDNLFENGINKLINEFRENNNNIISLKSVDDPRKFGVAEIDKNGNLLGIVEKPDDPKTSLAVAGIYGFNNKIFDHIQDIKKSKRGEYEITDAIKLSLNSSETINTQIIDGWWIDTGNLHDFLEANALKIKSNKNNDEALSSFSDPKNDGRCLIMKNSIIENSNIKNYSSIGNKVKILNSEIENSVILDYCEVENYKLKNCIISKQTKLVNPSSNMKIIENKII